MSAKAAATTLVERLWTIPEACAALRFTRKTVQRMIRLGAIEALDLGDPALGLGSTGITYRIPQHAMERLFAQGYARMKARIASERKADAARRRGRARAKERARA